MKRPAYAKVNLSLDIVGRRADGYHLLRSVMQTVSLCDEVELVSGSKGKTEVFFDGEAVPREHNTVLGAVKIFFAETGLPENDGLRFFIHKRIPMQAGLGGGSADAAAALKLLDSHYRTGLSILQLQKIGLFVGTDVPFCLAGGTALAEGVGEKLQRAPSLPPCFLVICRPENGVATAQAYAAFDAFDAEIPKGTDNVLEALASHDPGRVGASLSNAFAAVGVSPKTKPICSEMFRFGAFGASMTGSGSAVFGLFAERRQAEDCRIFLAKHYPYVFLCEPISKEIP